MPIARPGQVIETHRLLSLYAREGWRRVSRRLALGRISLFRFTAFPPDRLIVAPTDLRSIDPFVAEEILEGRFPLAGRVIDTAGESPFEIDLPSREFAVRLHGFSWLRHIRALKDNSGDALVRRLLADWMETHGRSTSGISWEAEVIAQRVIAWLSHSPIVLRNADHIFYRRFLKSLAFQVSYLRQIADTVRDGDLRLRIRIALAMASVSMPASASTIRRAAQQLDRELDRQILPDGGHCSRNPCVGLDLLLDLLPLRQTYLNLGHDVPQRLIPCIDRIYPALRFFRHQSGDLALFNGATAVLANELMSVLRYDETAGEPFRALPDSGYHRLGSKGVAVIMDTGTPVSPELSRNAHAGALSFEMSSGRHRFIVNAGSPKFAGERVRQAARTTAAHSTVTLADVSSSRLLQSRFLGPIMAGGVSRVDVRREDVAGERETVIASHDGYLARFGLSYERDLSLGSDNRVLRGRERFVTADGQAPPAGIAALAVARFHIHPSIRIRAATPGDVHLTAPDGENWLFSCRDGVVEVEEDAFFADPSGVRDSRQITVTFDLADLPEIQWTLSRQA